MTGYASMTADEHEYEAIKWMRIADDARAGKMWKWIKVTTQSTRSYIRIAQNFAAMHMEDAQRMREYGRK